MAFWSRLFGGKGASELSPMPWDRRPSILEFVRSHCADKPDMAGDDYALPDEERINAGSKMRWGTGAMDGVMTHHLGTGGDEVNARKMVELVIAFTRHPSAMNKAAIYEQVIAERALSIIDPVIKALVNESNISHDRLYDLARSFVTEAPDREPVKFGIAILGLFHRPADVELIQVLGGHGEFTLFSAVALANASEDSDEALWALARKVTGWGRIHVVERLVRTTNPEIKRWLLMEGFRNSVMYEYLAAICARVGGLLAALSEDHVDRELLTAAGEIIQALIKGGPAEGIDDYEDARHAIESYLGHMASGAETVEDFLHVNSIKGYLEQDDSMWSDRYDAGWTNECRKSLRSDCTAILGRLEWADRIQKQLRSENEQAFANADIAAKTMGMDTWDIHWRRLQRKPADPGRWYHLLTACDGNRNEKVLEHAEANINLAAIATGAGDELGLGPDFEQHSCLGYVLQELRRFPGKGAPLIEAGLKSPVVSNRNMALNALAAQSREDWPRGLEEALERAVHCEPREDVRQRMRKVLRGEPL